MWRALLLSFLALLATPLSAQDIADYRLGGDAFMAGRIVSLPAGDDVADLFAAGDSVTTRGAITGSAHLAGRSVRVEGRVGQNLYAMGMQVDALAPVGGNATLAGDGITVTEPVSGNLRATGSRVELRAPVAGSALLAGGQVTVDGVVSGDVAVNSETVIWGGAAKVIGTLYIYAEAAEEIDVPDWVAASDRVVRKPLSEWERDNPAVPDQRSPSFWEKLRSFLGGVILVGLLATLLAALAPDWVGNLREKALAAPARALWIGFIGISAISGSVVLLVLTGIGVIVVPFVLLAAGLLAVAGYVLGAYVFGVWAVATAGRGVPQTTGERAVAAFAGAFVLALLALVPFLGWLATLAVAVAGAGALLIKWVQPGFYVSAD